MMELCNAVGTAGQRIAKSGASVGRLAIFTNQPATAWKKDSTYEKKDEKDVVPTGCRFEYPVGVCALNGLDENSAGK